MFLGTPCFITSMTGGPGLRSTGQPLGCWAITGQPLGTGQSLVCCWLVLDSVASTPQWIRQPKPRGCPVMHGAEQNNKSYQRLNLSHAVLMSWVALYLPVIDDNPAIHKILCYSHSGPKAFQVVTFVFQVFICFQVFTFPRGLSSFDFLCECGLLDEIDPPAVRVSNAANPRPEHGRRREKCRRMVCRLRAAPPKKKPPTKKKKKRTRHTKPREEISDEWAPETAKYSGKKKHKKVVAVTWVGSAAAGRLAEGKKSQCTTFFNVISSV